LPNGPPFGIGPNTPVALDLEAIPSPLQFLTSAVHTIERESQIYNRMCVAVRTLDEWHETRYVQWRLVVATAFGLWHQLHLLRHYFSYAVTDTYMYRVPDGLTDHERFQVRRVIPNQIATAFGIPRSVRVGYRLLDWDEGGGVPRGPSFWASEEQVDEFQCPCYWCRDVELIDLTLDAGGL
jgi:hypothetical protein